MTFATETKLVRISFQAFLLATLFVLIVPNPSLAQETSIDLEYRFNPSYSRGFRQPLYEGDRAGFFALQRTRLIVNYNNPDSLKAHLVFQDRRVWGEVNERQDLPEIAVFRAWVEKQFTPEFSLRLGRQGLVYDDQHILGELNWGGTLAHDLALAKYEKATFKLHLGIASNANRINQLKRELFTRNFYKNMQFLWLNKKWDTGKSSFFFVNHGLEGADSTARYTQTFGTNSSKKVGKRIGVNAVYFHQVGEEADRRSVNAHFWSFKLSYLFKKNIKLAIVMDKVSGTDLATLSDPAATSSTYNILYGLRHGRFGYLDYFYLLFDPVFGLRDYYLQVDFSPIKDFKIKNQLHWFGTDANTYGSADASFSSPLDAFIGIENDILLSYTWSKDFKASFGHSIMFGSNTLDEIFGGTTSKDNQFFYMVITASPRIFQKSFQ